LQTGLLIQLGQSFGFQIHSNKDIEGRVNVFPVPTLELGELIKEQLAAMPEGSRMSLKVGESTLYQTEVAGPA
jgi:hypothetical protein